jgi:hypothetical protein
LGLPALAFGQRQTASVAYTPDRDDSNAISIKGVQILIAQSRISPLKADLSPGCQSAKPVALPVEI